MSEVLKVFKKSGFFYQCSSEERFEELTRSDSQVAYAGFDCTADSFHVGNLALIMLMRKWQQMGHKPVILLGGGTTLIGDPSGKDKSRKMLTTQMIEHNKEKLTETFKKFLDFSPESTNAATIVDNAQWLKSLNLLDILREVGTYFTLNRLLTFESIKSRLDREQPLTYLEFNYMILQAYDFYALNKSHGINFQFGGSDQWGNMISGMELIRKKTEEQTCVMTIPLLTTADGKKMGKSESGAIWLNADKMSDFDYWQFWRNCHDDDVVRFLKIYTDMSLDEIDSLAQKHSDNPNPLKEILANEATALLRGREASDKARNAALSLFKDSHKDAEENLPQVPLSIDEYKNSLLIDFLVQKELFPSKGSCRKFIVQGGLRVDFEKETNPQRPLSDIRALEENGKFVLSLGKKKHLLVKVQRS